MQLPRTLFTRINVQKVWATVALAALAPFSHAFLREATLPPETTQVVGAKASRSLEGESSLAPFLDPTNPDLARLQAPIQAFAGLPKDKDGKVDWVQALRNGTIQPRMSLQATEGGGPLDLDVIMKRTRQMPYVRFPHRTHTEWLACSNCHPALFEARAGTTQIRMEDIFKGRFCGTCHDRVAFVTHRNCDRCHSVPQVGEPPQP